jgi:hypothetical protein
MQTLKSLKFSAAPKRSFDDPIQRRRAKLTARLEEQKALAEDPTFVAVEQRWERATDGRREPVTVTRRVRRWWRADAAGAVYLTLKYGQKTIELEKGKPAIQVPSKEALPEVFDLLITAVQNGELDDALANVSKTLRFKNRSASKSG